MEEVPVELRRLWRLPVDSRMGRPAVLDVDRVVTTAVELADRDGLTGVTLPTVAATFRVTPMSLYRHVGSKAELLELMRDHAGGPAPDLGDEQGWRSGLRSWAVAQREVFERHPWLAQLPVSGPPSGPNAVSWIEACLRTLRLTGLSWGAKLGVVSLLGTFVRSLSQTRQELAEGRAGSGMDQVQAEQAYGLALARLVDPDSFPETAAMFGSQVFGPPPDEADDQGADPEPDLDPDFTFGLELILDGVAAAIARGA